MTMYRSNPQSLSRKARCGLEARFNGQILDKYFDPTIEENYEES